MNVNKIIIACKSRSVGVGTLIKNCRKLEVISYLYNSHWSHIISHFKLKLDWQTLIPVIFPVK